MAPALRLMLGFSLLAIGCLFLVASAHAEEEDVIHARVTFYPLRGVMASGVYTHPDAAACSRWMPFGTQLRFPDGFVVTCLDRGLGDRYWSAWIDIWSPSYQWGLLNVERDYGLWTDVSVVRWGWGE